MTVKTRVGPTDVLTTIRDHPYRRGNSRPRILNKADILRMFDEDTTVMTSVRAGIDRLIETGLLLERGNGWLLAEDVAEIEEHIARNSRDSFRYFARQNAEKEILARYRTEVDRIYNDACEAEGLAPERETD